MTLMQRLKLSLTGHATAPAGLQPVQGFNLDRYLGKWYEISRFDHPFERGLSRVTADYALREDGGVGVVNRGYDAATGRWKEATAKAYLIGGPDEGFLRVSFFGPFYGMYIVLELDREDYSYAMVCAGHRSYLWILGREPAMAAEVKQMLTAKAAALGFDTGKLRDVRHD